MAPALLALQEAAMQLAASADKVNAGLTIQVHYDAAPLATPGPEGQLALKAGSGLPHSSLLAFSASSLWAAPRTASRPAWMAQSTCAAGSWLVIISTAPPPQRTGTST